MTKDKSIFIKNIYYMLSYAFTNMIPEQEDEIAAEEFDNIHNLFAAILAKGIGQQLKQGLYREYLNKTEDMPVMRGKIDMSGTIKNKLARKQVLTCEFDEHPIALIASLKTNCCPLYRSRLNSIDRREKQHFLLQITLILRFYLCMADQQHDRCLQNLI